MNKVFNTTKSPGRWKEEIKERARKEGDRLRRELDRLFRVPAEGCMVYARIRPGFKRTAKRLIRDAEMEAWEKAVHYGHPLLSAIGWKGALPECR